MSSIQIAGNTSGTITLDAPNVAGTTTLTLPTTSGTIVTTGTTGQVIASGALPIGSVLQVVNAITSTNVSNSTATMADTGLTATITPKFSKESIGLIHMDHNDRYSYKNMHRYKCYTKSIKKGSFKMTFLASDRPISYVPTLILPFFKSLTFSIRLSLDRDPDLCVLSLA